jgi:hypothetical protein
MCTKMHVEQSLDACKEGAGVKKSMASGPPPQAKAVQASGMFLKCR